MNMPRVANWLAASALVLACSGEENAEQKPEAKEPATEPAPPAPEEKQAPAPDAAPAVVPLRDFATGDDADEALRAIASKSAWTAALDRYELLARRGQSGPVHGYLIAADDGTYLVDETFGDGALSIPVALPKSPELSLPMRVVLWGAWKPASEGDWLFHASRVERLDTGQPAPAVRERLTPVDEAMPEETTLVSKAPRRGGYISFVVKKRSSRVGDGWLVADHTKARASARLLLPGERETYGDQSSLGRSERWSLVKGKRYWLKVRGYRPGSLGELPVLRARTIPAHDPRGPSAAPAPESPAP